MPAPSRRRADAGPAHLGPSHLTDFASRIPDLLDESGLLVNRVRRIV